MCHARMRSLVDAIEGGAFGEIEAILHIGIGGSALGPDLVIDALGRDADRYDVRVLANIDGEAFDEAVSGLDPAATLVVGVSKTFTTIETLTNVDAAIEWLREGGVEDPHGQLIAVTAAPDAALAYRHRRNAHPAVRRGGRRALQPVVDGRAVDRAGARLGGVTRNCSRARARWTAMSASTTTISR